MLYYDRTDVAWDRTRLSYRFDFILVFPFLDNWGGVSKILVAKCNALHTLAMVFSPTLFFLITYLFIYYHLREFRRPPVLRSICELEGDGELYLQLTLRFFFPPNFIIWCITQVWREWKRLFLPHSPYSHLEI